ncbi:5460_t:CDS:2 [Funneliformis geosporum]|uniref:5460_t:CDS:1 n=1 Tax=Funneliformis geosporum TaxID=1117311 RepID=A0A9W4SHQ6_9GLOM|nr:5460_t:CDS:2 [Funneliformis geosporum]
MSIPPDINTIFDINEVEEYINWIKSLEKAVLSYVRLECETNWVVLEKDINGQSGGYVIVLNNTKASLGGIQTKATNRTKGNKEHRVLKGLDCLSIHKILQFRAIKLQDRVKEECSNSEKHSQDIQTLRDGLVTRDDIYAIVYNRMKTLAYFDQDELVSLKKWKRRKLDHKYGLNIDPNKAIIWNDLWQLMKTEGWNDIKAQEQLTKMVYVRGNARDMIDTNNLIEAFHHKLKYTYMREHLRCQLDGKVYLLPDIWTVHSMINDDVEYTVQKKDFNENELNTSSFICTCRDFKIRQLACKHIFAILVQVYIHDDNVQK